MRIPEPGVKKPTGDIAKARQRLPPVRVHDSRKEFDFADDCNEGTDVSPIPFCKGQAKEYVPRHARSLVVKPRMLERPASVEAPRKIQTEKVDQKQEDKKKDDERQKGVREASAMPYLRAVIMRRQNSAM